MWSSQHRLIDDATLLPTTITRERAISCKYTKIDR